MTPFGLSTLLAGLAALVLGLAAEWRAFDLIGIGLLLVVAVGFLSVARPSRLVIDREIQPTHVPKGAPAIAFVTFANRSRRPVPVTVAVQQFSGTRVRTVIPRLRGSESGTRAYRLPTTRRGIFDVEPIEVTRRDAFELFRLSRRYGATQRIWVTPRILDLRRLPTGQARHLEGPSSDTAPQGNITFHRLREYVPGDDLRLVHWRTSARAGTLLVKHNVDTSQPYTVVVLDLRPQLYTEASFEHAVDMAASVVRAGSADKAPVELLLTDGSVVGGPQAKDSAPLLDHLTAVQATSTGSLRDPLLALRRTRGGTSLVVITGELDPADLPLVAAHRRRFDRLVVVSIDPETRPPVEFPGVRVIHSADAESAANAWNLLAVQ